MTKDQIITMLESHLLSSDTDTVGLFVSQAIKAAELYGQGSFYEPALSNMAALIGAIE